MLLALRRTRLRCHDARRYARKISNTTVELRAPHPTASFERTTPVLFLRGPWHSCWAWKSTMERLSKLGFESQALGYTECFQKSYDSALSTVDNEVENIARVSSKGTPPILVAHGVGTFVAQKYLESYAASGLVMIAPFPPHPKNTLKRIIGATLKDLLPVDSSGVLEDLNHLVKLEPDPSGLLQDAARPENVLNLEPLGQFMDVLLVSTLTDPIVTQRDMTAIRNLHELLDDDSQSLTFNGSKGHLTMAEASWEETGGISDQIVDWIDRRY